MNHHIAISRESNISRRVLSNSRLVAWMLAFALLGPGAVVAAAGGTGGPPPANENDEALRACMGNAVVQQNHWGSYAQVFGAALKALSSPEVVRNLQVLDIPKPDPCAWPDPSVLEALPPPLKSNLSIEERRRVHANWDPRDMPERRKAMGLIGPGPQGKPPVPAYPSYLSRPKSIEQMMPKARAAVTQTGGFSPYGIVKPGETVLIVLSWFAEREVYDAIARAFGERNIKVKIIYENELVGIEKQAIQKLFSAAGWWAGSGELETHILVNEAQTGVWPNSSMAKVWFKTHDRELFDAIWPMKVEFTDPEIARAAQFDWPNVTPDRHVTEALIGYLDNHPEIDRIFWREAGLFLVGAALRHHKDKFVAHNLYNDYLRLMSKAGEFPSSVWRMIETKTIESLAYGDRVEVSDPEGTAIWWEMTEKEAQNFSKGAYLQGHLLMTPSMAGGRTPQSMVNYPAYGSDYIPPMFAKSNGILCSTNAHMGTHPLMCVHVKDGLVVDVEGGGLYGESFKLALHYPGLKEFTWPYFKEANWWRLAETSLATNPKYFKHPLELLRGDNLSERMPAGVIHWAYGAMMLEGPELSGMGTSSPVTKAFGMKYNLPVGHGMHQHTVLPTYQVRIRDTNQWETVINNGRMAALDDPEVRALAARYGNPDEILSLDYVPPYPGVNVPGNYMEDYAKDPGTYWTKWAKSIVEGSSPYLEKDAITLGATSTGQ